VTSPEDALDLARERAAAARARGRYADDYAKFAIDPVDAVTLEHLLEWAVVEPDVSELRSTRRAGAPITWLKRLLYRLLRQYHGQVIAQQSRFNIQLAVYVSQLADRVEELERRERER
jgi:hypothetical protein